METQEAIKPRELKVEEITSGVLAILFKDWENSHSKGVEDNDDYLVLEYDQNGRSWKFNLDTRPGISNTALLSCDGEIKACLAGITKVVLTDNSISFASKKSQYKVSEQGLRHHIDFSDNPRASATVDVPKRIG